MMYTLVMSYGLYGCVQLSGLSMNTQVSLHVKHCAHVVRIVHVQLQAIELEDINTQNGGDGGRTDPWELINNSRNEGGAHLVHLEWCKLFDSPDGVVHFDPPGVLPISMLFMVNPEALKEAFILSWASSATRAVCKPARRGPR